MTDESKHLDTPFLEDVYRTLLENKSLPKYQFERRVDIFLTVFLPEVLSQLLGGDVRVVAPEFPIKKADNNQSTNVDYVLFRHAQRPEDESWLFLELKTDCGSVSQDQIDIYRDAIGRGMPALMKNLQVIREATKAKAKYDALISRFQGLPSNRPIELIYLAPGDGSRVDLGGIGRFLPFSSLASMELQRHASEWLTFRDAVIRKLV